MYFQKVVKGINGINTQKARDLLDNGIICNWWRNAQKITPLQIKEQLVEPNVEIHLNEYDTPLPSGHPLSHLGSTFGDVTPFISTSAGAIQIDHFNRVNILFPPFMTALRFATDNFKSSGFIFYCSLITLGRKAVEFEQFAEEVRELHIYQNYLPYHHEGEIMAKIIIPSIQIEKAVEFNGPAAKADLDNGKLPQPLQTLDNYAYCPPENYSNIRELLP